MTASVLATIRRLIEDGRYQEALGLLGPAIDDDASVEALDMAVAVLQKLGQIREASRVARRLVARQRETNNRAGLGAALLREGALLMSLQEFEIAREALAEYLDICTAAGDRSGEARGLHRLGDFSLRQGDEVKAREYLERCQSIRRAVGDSESAAFFAAEDLLTVIALRQGRYEAARLGYQERLSRLAGKTDPQSTARSLHSLGIIEYATGNFREARPVLERSLKIWRDLGVPAQEARVLASLAAVSIGDGDSKAGARLIEQALDAIELLEVSEQRPREVLEQLCALAVQQRNIEVGLAALLLVEREIHDQEATRDVSLFVGKWQVENATLDRIRAEADREYGVDRGRRMIRSVLAALTT